MTCERPIKMMAPTGEYDAYSPLGKKIDVPCGQCNACQMTRAQNWANRMLWETPYWEEISFGTYTYEKEPEGRTIVKKDLQDFFKRVRKDRKIMYYACGEYGETHGRPHYHAIIFGIGSYEQKYAETKWGHGQVRLDPWHPNRALYAAGYVLKSVNHKVNLAGRAKPFALMSQGIGKRFALANREKFERREITVNGKQVGIPRYFKSLGIEPEEYDYMGEIYDIHVARNPHLDDIEDMDLIMESIERSREQASLDLAGKISMRKHENGL